MYIWQLFVKAEIHGENSILYFLFCFQKCTFIVFILFLSFFHYNFSGFLTEGDNYLYKKLHIKLKV